MDQPGSHISTYPINAVEPLHFPTPSLSAHPLFGSGLPLSQPLLSLRDPGAAAQHLPLLDELSSSQLYPPLQNPPPMKTEEVASRRCGLRSGCVYEGRGVKTEDASSGKSPPTRSGERFNPTTSSRTGQQSSVHANQLRFKMTRCWERAEEGAMEGVYEENAAMSNSVSTGLARRM